MKVNLQFTAELDSREAPMTLTELTLTEFLLARVTEDETAARRAGSAAWANSHHNIYLTGDQSSEVIAVGPWDGDLGDAAEHMARHDPARTLAECRAKRAIVAQYAAATPQTSGTDAQALEQCVMSLAQVYGDHPDYRPEWKPQR
jgi:hypothetical protein